MQHQAISQQRLASQRIALSTFTQPHEVVAWLGAMQGQDYAGAKWAIGLRLPGSTDAAVEQAIASRTIVRTWAMRGTLHLVAAADIRWIVALLGPRLIAGSARRYRELELDAPTLAQSSALLAAALAGDAQCDRNQLFSMLQHNGIATTGQRGIHMLQHASLQGLICQIGTVRNIPAFIALDGVPRGPELEPDAALRELARRFFRSHGPATLKDFVRWAGIAVTAARAGIADAAAELIAVTIDGERYWMDAATAAAADVSGVYTLPGFDEYVLGYADRSAVLDARFANQIVPGGNGIFYPTIVSDGQIIGTWRRTAKRAGINLTPEPFTALSDAELAGFAAAAAQYGRFVEQPVRVEPPVAAGSLRIPKGAAAQN